MAERLHRTQILLDPKQHQALATLARNEGRSISELVREMVQQALAQREQGAQATLRRQLAALQRIRAHRDAIVARRGGRPLELDAASLIHHVREEQDERNLADVRDHRR